MSCREGSPNGVAPPAQCLTALDRGSCAASAAAGGPRQLRSSASSTWLYQPPAPGVMPRRRGRARPGGTRMADPSGATSLSCSRPKSAGPWLRCTDSVAASVRTAVCCAAATWEVRLPGSRVAGYGPSGPGCQNSTIARTNSAAWIARSRKPAVMAQDGQVPPVLGDLGARSGERPPQMGHQRVEQRLPYFLLLGGQAPQRGHLRPAEFPDQTSQEPAVAGAFAADPLLKPVEHLDHD